VKVFFGLDQIRQKLHTRSFTPAVLCRIAHFRSPVTNEMVNCDQFSETGSLGLTAHNGSTTKQSSETTWACGVWL
jgi:hypothetical protein